MRLLLLLSVCVVFFSCKDDKKEINTYYSNGNIKEKYYKKDGLLSGMYVTYYENGNTETEVEYSNGIANGQFTAYYSNGKLKKTYQIVNGHGEGPFFVYDSIGNIIKKGKYINGRINGFYRKYYSSGRTECIMLLFDDKIVSSACYEEHNTTNPKNTIDMMCPDTFNTSFVETKIIMKNCNYDRLVFYEGKIDTSRYYDLRDTLGVYNQINDSVVVYRKDKVKKGSNHISGILYATKKMTDTTLFYPYPIMEWYYVK